jgi:hypothetical protein
MLCRQGEIFWVDGRDGRADGMGKGREWRVRAGWWRGKWWVVVRMDDRKSGTSFLLLPNRRQPQERWWPSNKYVLDREAID